MERHQGRCFWLVGDLNSCCGYKYNSLLLPINTNMILYLYAVSLGLTVNGELFETPASTLDRPLAYFSKIAVLFRRIEIVFTQTGKSVNTFEKKTICF